MATLTSLGQAREVLEVVRRRHNDIRPRALVPPENGDPVTPTDLYIHGQAAQPPKWQSWVKVIRKKLGPMVANTHPPLLSDAATEAVA